MLPLDFLQALSMQPQEFVDPTEPAIETIDYSKSENSRAACLGNGDLDSDKDGLADDCALEHFPYTYNGWIVGGRYFDSKDPRLTLTEEENAEWKRDSAERGGIGFGNISGHAQKLVKKFSALKKLSDSDMGPLREIFYSYSQEPIRISDSFRSYERSDAFQSSQYDDANLGLAAGDGEESIPYDHTKPATSVAGLTAFGKDTDSYREQGRFKMLVYDTNVVIPKNSNSLQVTIGHLSNQNFVMPPKTGMYYVINNGDSILLQNELLNDKGRDFQGSRFGTIYRNTGCTTAHLTIVYITDGSYDRRGQAILPEVVAFRASEKNPWTTLSQEYFSIQPQGGIDCQQGFGANDVRNEKTFFKTSTNISRRVPGVIDFNTSLGTPGIANPNKMLDRSSTSIELIQEEAKEKPVSKMTAAETYEYEKALLQLEKSALPTDDQKWLDDQFKAIEDRKKTLKQDKVVGEQFTQLDQLNKKLATIDATSPEYAPTVAKIDEILKALTDPTAAPLTDEQKKTLADQTAAYNTRKTAIQTPAVNPKAIKVSTDADATIPLSADDLSKLKELGYVFKDAQGNEIPAGKGVNLTPEQLDVILAQSADELGKGTMDQNKAKALTALLDSLKKNKKVDAKKIDQFSSNYGKKLKKATLPPAVLDPKTVQYDSDGDVDIGMNEAVILDKFGFKLKNEDGTDQDRTKGLKPGKITDETLDAILGEFKTKIEGGALTPEEATNIQDFLGSLKKSPGVDQDKLKDFTDEYGPKLVEKSTVKWTPEQLDYLKSIDTPFSKLNPGFGSGKVDQWSQGFKSTSDEFKAKEEALGKIESKLLDPSTLSNFTSDERVAEAEKMKKIGLMNTDRYLALRLNLAKLGNMENADFSFKPAKTSVGKDTSGKDIFRDVITLEGATIRFESGSNQIKFGSQQLLKRIAKEIQNYKTLTGKNEVHVLLKAFTDPSGTAAANQKLSECRANAVKDFFTGKISIEKCNGKGVIVGEFGVDDEAHIADDQKLNEAVIKAMGLGVDTSKGNKVTEAVAEKLRRVEIYLSDKPF